jgi:hypothetical protein
MAAPHPFKKYDHYTTPESAWKELAPFVPKDKTIWMPFYSDGKAGEIMNSLGFNAIHENEDFFKHDRGEIIVDNMPYSIKEAVFTRLKELNKPFMMLVPIDTFSSIFFQELFDLSEVQLLVPRRRVNCIKMNEQGTAPLPNRKSTPFRLVWTCWRMNFPQQLNYIGTLAPERKVKEVRPPELKYLLEVKSDNEITQHFCTSYQDVIRKVPNENLTEKAVWKILTNQYKKKYAHLSLVKLPPGCTAPPSKTSVFELKRVWEKKAAERAD